MLMSDDQPCYHTQTLANTRGVHRAWEIGIPIVPMGMGMGMNG